jgi:Carboxypeptidase regulatory-like domain
MSQLKLRPLAAWTCFVNHNIELSLLKDAAFFVRLVRQVQQGEPFEGTESLDRVYITDTRESLFVEGSAGNRGFLSMTAGQHILTRLRSSNLLRALALVTVFSALPAILHAQSTSASLTGRITDASKAVVPNAKIVAINTGTRVHYESVTNETGSYYVTNLPPGTYRIEVEKLGFKAVLVSDLVLHVQDALEINFEMVLGSASESVTVRGGAPLLDTESATLGTVVEQRKANELPLNGRNVFNLIELSPSVVPQGSSTGTPVGVNPFGWGNYQVDGSFGNESAQYLDGQPLNIGYINLPVLIPTQDSIQEFKIQTSNLGPEWGKFAGGVTNLSTKTGTSEVHGEIYEYLRNKIFNANDFFLNSVGRPRPAWVQNQFGGNAGGPLNLPHVGQHNRTFWFFSGEGFRLRTSEPFTATVPDAAERAGNFSALCQTGFTNGICNDRGTGANGKLVVIDQIYDPCGGGVNSLGACPGSTAAPVPFANNIIPLSRQNSTSLKLLDLWPAPSNPNVTTNNFTTATPTGGDQNQIVSRLDHNFTNDQRLFLRFNYWHVKDLPIDPLGTGLCADRCAENYHSYALASGYTYSINGTTMFEWNSSVTRFLYNRNPKNAGFDLTTIGWPGSYNAVIPAEMRTPPTPCVANFADNIMCTQGQSFIQDRNTQVYLSPSVSMLRGHQQFHFGFQLAVDRDNYAQSNIASGSFNFCVAGQTCFTSLPGVAGTGSPFADFLLGYADNFNNFENHFFDQAVVPAFTAGQEIYRAWYFQDSWHTTRKLTVNLGLRYDLQGTWSERFNRLSYFDPTATNYLTQYLPVGSAPIKGDVFLVSPSDRTNIPLQKDQLAPRVGLAYGINPNTVVRVGYGIFWIPNYVAFSQNPLNDGVNAAATTYTGTVDGIHPVNTIELPFPAGISPPPGTSLGPTGTQRFMTQVVQSITEVDPNDHPEGYVQQWNLDFQRELPAGFFVSAAYVGSKGTHLAQYSQQINQISDSLLAQAASQVNPSLPNPLQNVTLLQSVPNPFFVDGQALALSGPTTTVGQLLRPYPQYTGVQLAGQGSYTSIYESFQLTAQRRFASAGSLLVAYTNAKLISNTDTLTAWLEPSVGAIQDNNNLRGEQSLSSQDVPQRLVISYVLDLPFGKGKKFFSGAEGSLDKLIGGWGLDGVTVFQRGFPLAFTNGQANGTTLFGGGSRPNKLPGCLPGRSGDATSRLDQWFNTACFAAPADFTFGDEPRVEPRLRAEGINNFDFAVFKRTRFRSSERLGLEFRTEFFNLFNRTQFAAPNTVCCSANNANFGVVTATAPGTNPRLVQFALKVFF